MDWASDEHDLRINWSRWSVHLSMAAVLESWSVSVSELKCPSVRQSKECSTFLHHQAPFMNLSSCPSCIARMSLCGRNWTGSTAQVRPLRNQTLSHGGSIWSSWWMWKCHLHTLIYVQESPAFLFIFQKMHQVTWEMYMLLKSEWVMDSPFGIFNQARLQYEIKINIKKTP